MPGAAEKAYYSRLREPGAVLRFLTSFDYVQIVAMALLLGIGVTFIYSTGQQVGSPGAGTVYLKQLQWIGCGLAAYFGLALVDYRRLLVPSVFFYLVCLALLMLVFVIGVTVYGAQRWINIPGIGLRLQPSEPTKVAVIAILSGLFASRMFAIDEDGGRRRSGQLLGIVAAGIAIAIPFYLIVREPDLGSALILVPTGAAIIFVAGLRWKILSWTIGIALVGFCCVLANEFWPRNELNKQGEQEIVYAGIHPLLKDYQRERILTFLDPERDLQHRGYNQFQARLAVGTGGMTGKGIGHGTQNMLGFLPQSVSNNDFIFAVIAEETGFLGCLFMLSSYILLFYALLRTAVLCEDPFGRYLAVGVATMIFTHCFINIGMSIGITPVTGVPLPFISYGGSFVMTGMVALGVIQSVYRYNIGDRARD